MGTGHRCGNWSEARLHPADCDLRDDKHDVSSKRTRNALPRRPPRTPEEKHAAIAQGEMKERKNFLLRIRPQIDQDIATADEVYIGERRIGQDIVNREHHAIT